MSENIDNLYEEAFIKFRSLVESGEIRSLEPILPLVLALKGKPYTLEDHFVMSPMFTTDMPQNMAIWAGRQVSKSTSMAASSVLLAASIPYFSVLYITPLYDQVRRLSNDYVKPFIEQSPVKSLWINSATENSVLQRSFINNSRMYFSFALLDADRVRGISSSMVNFDEIQDMDQDHIPIIKETLSHSEWGITRYTGTPKTEDNTIEGLRQRTSMAEWFIKCKACNYWNIPSKEFDIIRMIGPYREDISEDQPGIICAKCMRPISPRQGRWVHRFPDKRNSFPGYHIPQIIMPIHYSKPKKWAELLAKQAGAGNTTEAKFVNECLGESFDQSTKLVTETDLKKACSLHWKNNPNDFTEPLQHLNDYNYRVLSIDWGGGGQDETSFTVFTILGYRNGKIDVLWGKRSLIPYDHIGEAKEALRLFNSFKCHFLIHDYTGAGSLRETFIHHTGIPLNKIIPIAYVGAASKDLMSSHKATKSHPRDYYLLDKSRSLQLTCNCIKLGVIRFFDYDYRDADNPGLVRDFLSLIENKIERAKGSDVYTIIRNHMFSDDFAQAVNIGACALFKMTNSWPNLASLEKIHQSIDNMLKDSKKPVDATWNKDK